MKIVHAADIHLDSPLVGLARYESAPAERIREATRRAFENLITLCIEERAELLLLAGDLYDGGWRDYSTGLFFAREMSRLREANVAVVWIRGNHDAASQITRRLRLPDNVRELAVQRAESAPFEHLGVVVHGQGFASREVKNNIALAYPDPLPGLVNIGLLHTSLTGRPGHESYAPCRVEELAHKGYDYWALGHVHAREVVSEEPWIVFPGNLQGRHARETGEKGATVLEIDGGRIVRVSPVVLDVVRWCVCRVDASRSGSADDVLEATRRSLEAEVERADGRLLAARVVVHGATRAHLELGADPERWVQDVRALALEVAYGDVWIEKVQLETQLGVDHTDLRDRDDPLGHVMRALDELRHSDAELGELGAAFDDLRPKLRDLGGGPDPISLEDPRALASVVHDVERLIVSRLLGRGREP